MCVSVLTIQHLNNLPIFMKLGMKTDTSMPTLTFRTFSNNSKADGRTCDVRREYSLLLHGPEVTSDNRPKNIQYF